PIPHYPPYTSKYNPIGHRFFPRISPLYQGLIFESVQTVKVLMATVTIRTGFKLLMTILYKTYQTGRNGLLTSNQI
ncbi:ISAzo13-like element transposase-related protein, partial [Trichormus azollae]|uniref:ISAzo13-like element transposase-related protein n=1 Tax=Trichormus azollae TaxID=1164 RepID=UPI00325C9D32